MASVPLRRNRDFWLLWSGQALSGIGSQVSSVAFPLLTLALTGSPAKAGVVGLAKWVPSAAFAIPAGALADRVNRKQLMVACDGVRALAMILLAGQVALGTAHLGIIAAVAAIDGAGWVVTFAAERGAMAQIVPPDQLSDAAAQNESRSFAASLAGPPLGGLLFGLGRSVPFLADAISYIASVTSKLLITGGLQEPRTGATPGSVWDGLRWIWQRSFFRTCALLWAAGTPVLTGLELLAVVIAKRHHTSSALIGIMLGIGAAGGLLGALRAPALQRRSEQRIVLVGESWLIGLAVLPLLFVHGPVLMGLALAVAWLLTPVSNAIIVSLRVGLAPDHLQGRVNAASIVISMSTAWLGPVGMGLLLQGAGVTATILICSGWMSLLAAAVTASRAFRHPPTRPLPASAPTAGH